MTISRRDFIQMAAAMGASLAWAGPEEASAAHWRERRDLFPEGVASGDPDPHSVILWSRRPFDRGQRHVLTVEVAADEAFRRIVATAPAPVSAAADWTCRVLVAGLQPATVYWYRFTDADGNGSRVGRTITAPDPGDGRPVNFAFVSCQDINDGKLNAYRRMIFEDEKAAPADQLGFVLHLGDFIYEVIWYPEDLKTRFDRPVYEVCRIPDAGKAGNVHFPLTVEGYRAVYRAYLRDPDLQDARARWPFVAMWDNHEFSWQGWQSIVKGGGYEQPGQSVKVAANQAWFEYQPARVSRPSSTSLETFDPPAVKDVKIERFDADGLGDEPNNRIAINSLKAYRALRYGRHLDLILTDQHSYRGPDPFGDPSLNDLGGNEFPQMLPEDLMEVLDGGRAYDGSHPPDEIHFGEAKVKNPRKNAPPQTILGAEQKAWFTDRLRASSATWKIWGNSQGTLDQRADPQNLPAGLTVPWPSSFANMGGGDYGTAYVERGEIYDLVRDARITGFRDRVRRPAQLLGGLRGQGTSPQDVRACRTLLRRGIPLQPGRDGGQRAPVSQGPSAAAAVPRGPTRRRQAGVDAQHAAEARSALVSRVCEEPGPRPRSRALQPLARAAPGVRRSRGTRLREGAAVRRRDAHRVRVHPAPDQARRAPRRRSAPLSGRPQRCTVEGRGAARAPPAGRRRRSGTVDLRGSRIDFMSNPTRREVLRLGGAAAASVLLAPAARAAAWKKIPIATQLWCVRKQLATDIPGTLSALGAMGYEAVELENAFGKSGAEWRKHLDAAGLKACGFHHRLSELQGDQLAASVDFNRAIGNRNLVIRSLAPAVYESAELLKTTADAVNEVAERLRPQGMRVGYHNHTTDFNRIDGEYWWNRFADQTAKDVMLQFDTWQRLRDGGGHTPGPDPAQPRPHDLDSRQALLEEGPERLPWSRRPRLARHHDGGRDRGRHRVVHHRVREGGSAAPRIAEGEPGAVQETPELITPLGRSFR
jgi:alkaline phosphatase D